jgi:hypothetical protein
MRFSVAGWPGRDAELAATTGIDLVPIDGPEIESLVKRYSFFSSEEIPDGAYRNVAGVKTVSVNAIWATTTKQPDALIYSITAALWNANTRKLLDSGHAKGRAIRLETALQGLGIPLHAGAEKYYRERTSSSKFPPYREAMGGGAERRRGHGIDHGPPPAHAGTSPTRWGGRSSRREGRKHAIEGQGLRRHGGGTGIGAATARPCARRSDRLGDRRRCGEARGAGRCDRAPGAQA